jgi:hypothetical protein
LQYFRSPAQLLVHDRPSADGLVLDSCALTSSDCTETGRSFGSGFGYGHGSSPGFLPKGAVGAAAAASAAVPVEEPAANGEELAAPV